VHPFANCPTQHFPRSRHFDKYSTGGFTADLRSFELVVDAEPQASRGPIRRRAVRCRALAEWAASASAPAGRLPAIDAERADFAARRWSELCGLQLRDVLDANIACPVHHCCAKCIPGALQRIEAAVVIGAGGIEQAIGRRLGNRQDDPSRRPERGRPQHRRRTARTRKTHSRNGRVRRRFPRLGTRVGCKAASIGEVVNVVPPTSQARGCGVTAAATAAITATSAVG